MQQQQQHERTDRLFSLVRHNRYKEVCAILDGKSGVDDAHAAVDVDATDKKGNTLLLVACQNGLKRMAKAALRRGANINHQNLLGNSPLHFCCAYGFTELAAYLISKGADAALENSYGSLCTEGLGKAALQLIEDAQEQRQQREADGEDLDTASIYTATDRSQIEEDIAAGPVVDGSLVQTLEPIFDDYDESSWQYGQVEAFEEGGAEHHGDGNLVEDYEYYDQYDEGVSAEVEVESEKKEVWRPLPRRPPPRPLPPNPRPLPSGARPLPQKEGPSRTESDAGAQTAGVLPSVKGAKPKTSDSTDESIATAGTTAMASVAEKPFIRYKSVLECVHAKDRSALVTAVAGADQRDIDSAMQTVALKGYASMVETLLQAATSAAIDRALFAATSRGHDNIIELILSTCWRSDETPHARVHVGSSESTRTQAEKQAQVSQRAIDRSLERAASSSESSALELLLQHASESSLTRALVSATVGGRTAVSLKLLPYCKEGAQCRILVPAATSNNCEMIQKILLHEIDGGKSTTPTGNHVHFAIGQAIEAAAARGHEEAVRLLWPYCETTSYARAEGAARLHGQTDLVAEIASWRKALHT